MPSELEFQLLCTGQSPNTELLTSMDPATVNPDDRLAHVLRTMQLGVLSPPVAEVPVKSARPVPAVEATIPESSSTIVSLELETPLKQLSVADPEAPATSDEGRSSGPSTTEEETLITEHVLETPYPNMFVIGDAADAFGAIPAGHNAYYQVRSPADFMFFVLTNIVI